MNFVQSAGGLTQTTPQVTPASWSVQFLFFTLGHLATEQAYILQFYWRKLLSMQTHRKKSRLGWSQKSIPFSCQAFFFKCKNGKIFHSISLIWHFGQFPMQTLDIIIQQLQTKYLKSWFSGFCGSVFRVKSLMTQSDSVCHLLHFVSGWMAKKNQNESQMLTRFFHFLLSFPFFFLFSLLSFPQFTASDVQSTQFAIISPFPPHC